MKKRILLMTLVVVLVVGMAISGCAKPAPAPTTPTTPTTPAPTPTPPAPAKVYDWKFHTIIPASMVRYTVNIASYAKMVDEYTQGRIKLTTYPAPAIVPADQVADACAEGVVEMAENVGSYWAGKFPVWNVEYGLPLSYGSIDSMWTVLWYRGLQDLMTEALETRGLHYLGFDIGMGSRIISTKPIRTLDDFKGMKVRAIGTFADFYAKLGGGTVNIPMVEMYMGLKLGTIDAAVSGMDVLYDLKLQEVCKYFLPQQLGPEPLSITVNLNQWKALPEDLKAILTLVTYRFSHWVGSTVEMPKEKKILDGFRAAGVEIEELPPEDMAKMQATAIEIWDEWAKKDDYCRRGVAIMKDYAREQGRIK